MLALVLIKIIPKYLQYSYLDIKARLNKCDAEIVENVDLPEINPEYYAQIELNPIYEYENPESGVFEIVCDFFINDGRITLSTTLCFPQVDSPYCIDSIYDASDSKLAVKYCSINDGRNAYDG